MLTFFPRPRRAPGRRRFAFQPGLEAVESRILLATGAPLVVATLGDSITDEYSFYGPQPVPSLGSSASAAMGFIPVPPNIFTVGRNSARNWDLNLAATRSNELTFGAYTNGDQGETRNQGFANNWARSGATAAGFNIGGSGTTFPQEYLGYPNEFPGSNAVEQPGLLTQARVSDIDVVTILIGANDYLRGFTNYAQTFGRDDVFTPAVPNGLTPINSAVENAINEAVTQIQATLPNAKIVLVTTPDIIETPAAQAFLADLGGVYPKLGPLVSTSTAALSNDLTAFAASKGIGLVNFQKLYQRLIANPTIGGITLNPAASGQSLTDAYVGDGFHPGTIVQGVLAQAIVAQIDAQYGSNVVTPLTDADIVNYAAATTPSVVFTNIRTINTPDTVTLQAFVRAGTGSLTLPSGTVTFAYQIPATSVTPALPGSILGTVPINSAGVANLNISHGSFIAGTIVATYNGDQFNTVQNSFPSTPTLGSFLIDPATLDTLPIATTVELIPTYVKVRGRGVVTLTILIKGAESGPVGSPTGTVVIGVGPFRQKTVMVVNGRAEVSYPLSRLQGQFLASTYSGDARFAAGGSQFQRVDPHPFRPRAIDTVSPKTSAVKVAARRHVVTAHPRSK